MGFHVFFMLSDSFKLYYDKGKASPFRARKVLEQSLERKTLLCSITAYFLSRRKE